MPKSRADELREVFKRLCPEDQIHIAIERECRTERGYRDAQNRYSRDRLRQHDEWTKSHRLLLETFNLL